MQIATLKMIINTDKIKSRTIHCRKYIAIYGTQENPVSGEYDLLDKQEAGRFVISLKDAAARLLDEAEGIANLAETLDD